MKQKHPLQKYAEKSGKSISEIAKDAGCSAMTLYRLMKGTQNATIDLIKRVSDATDGKVKITDFIRSVK